MSICLKILEIVDLLKKQVNFFVDKGVHKVAQWMHLKMLYELESKNLVKLSNLNEVSIFPKPIEGYSVSTCLRVFCDKTYHALINHPGLQHIKEKQYTADFINIVVSWRKVLNVKGTGAVLDSIMNFKQLLEILMMIGYKIF